MKTEREIKQMIASFYAEIAAIQKQPAFNTAARQTVEELTQRYMKGIAALEWVLESSEEKAPDAFNDYPGPKIGHTIPELRHYFIARKIEESSPIKLTDFQSAQLSHFHLTGEFKVANNSGQKFPRTAWVKMLSVLQEQGLIEETPETKYFVGRIIVTAKGRDYLSENHQSISLRPLE